MTWWEGPVSASSVSMVGVAVVDIFFCMVDLRVY